MLSRPWFPLLVLSLLAAFPLSGRADEKQLPPRVRAEIRDLEFEVKKRELALQMAELGVEEAKVSLDKVRKLQNANAVGDEERAQAALHLKMRQLAAEMTSVELEQAKSRLNQLQETTRPLPVLDHPVQLEYLEDTDVIVARGSKEDVEKVVARIQKLEGKEKADPPIDAEQAAAIKQLLKARRDILRQMVDLAKESYRQGEAQHTDVIRASESLIEAELDLITDKAERIALREERVDNMKELEQVTTALQKAAEVGIAEVLAAKAARIKAQIELLREQANP